MINFTNLQVNAAIEKKQCSIIWM